ncbi:hypothetical protein [Caulobacter sp.]|uniref:hypothetical protein n=1 Tax=Caulobacter sp. TaxID=78 RepID=UPI001B0154D0|nr:hypothetical protein [Caulobacter sp.]MBO9545875.1 hypothetical protein [Caulobacter sp.]
MPSLLQAQLPNQPAATPSLEALGSWYQAVEIEGLGTPPVASGAEDSRFYNLGKWRNFIAPLLPAGRDAFCELGSNASLFLLCAAQAGFRRVIGVEPDAEWHGQGRFVLDHYAARDPRLYGGIELVKARVGDPGHGVNDSCLIEGSCEALDLATLPALDVMLLSNVLYWIEREASQAFIHQLADKARYAIVVSIEQATERGGPAALADVRAAFDASWIEREIIAGVARQGDPAPRRMFSLLFESRR